MHLLGKRGSAEFHQGLMHYELEKHLPLCSEIYHHYLCRIMPKSFQIEMILVQKLL